MEIDETTTAGPEQQTPHHRYASLHRAIERGMASAEVWRDLAVVCLELGQEEEAARICRQMDDGEIKRSLQTMLGRVGLRVPVRPREEPAAESPVHDRDAPGEAPSLLAHAIDSFEYLLHSHMPLVTLVAILAFPVVVGVGGFLTAGTSALLLPLIALLPGLCVMGMVGGMARTILVASASGEELPPAIPELKKLTADCLRFSLDAVLLPVLLLGPGLLLFFLNVPFMSMLPVLLAGAITLPMMLALRQLRSDWRALSPTVVMPAMFRCGPRYLGLAGMFWALFLPAVLALVCSAGSPAFLQISLAGPLTVAPLFAAARMLGTFVDAHRLDLDTLIKPDGSRSVREVIADTAAHKVTTKAPARPAPRPATKPTKAPAPAARPARKPAPAVSAGELAQARAAAAAARPAAPQPATAPARPAPQKPASAPAPRPAPKPASTPAPGRAPSAPAPAPAPARSQAAPARPQAAPARPQPAPARPQPAPPKPQPAPAKPQPAPARPQPAPRTASPRPQAPAPAPARKAPAAPISDPSLRNLSQPEGPPPELSQFPGASIVQGTDRHKFGASSRSR
jgi:hypothetical protein